MGERTEPQWPSSLGKKSATKELRKSETPPRLQRKSRRLHQKSYAWRIFLDLLQDSGGSGVLSSTLLPTLLPPPRLPPSADAFSADPAQQLFGVTAVRKLLSQASNPPVDAVIKAGLLPRLVALLQSVDAKLLVETSWAITNIASTDRTADVVAAGAIPALVQHLFHASAEVRDQAIWCLGNIAGDSPRFRDQLFNTPNAVQGIFMNVQHPASLTLLRNATWALSNFCRGKPSPPSAMVQPLIPALAYLVQQEDKEVISDAAWGLSHLTDGDE